jgi:hypothetical protein
MRAWRHLTYANVTATAALVVALGGTAVAAGHVTTADIVDGAVTTSKLAGKAVVAGKIAPAAVSASALAPKSVTPDAVDPSKTFPITVKNATRLGGSAAADYLQASMAQAVFSRTEQTAKTLLTIKGFGTLGIGCNNGKGFARFTNSSGKPVVVSIASTSSAIRSQTVQSGAAINGPQSTGGQLQTWRIHQGNAGSNVVGTAWIELVKGSKNQCSGSIQSLSKH